MTASCRTHPALFALLLVLLAGGLGLRPAPVRAQASDAYLDAHAGELVRSARQRRALLDRRIDAYQTLARERVSFEMSAMLRDRLLYRRETASRVHWHRADTVRIEVLGAREVLPPLMRRMQIPTDLGGQLPSLAFDPAESELLLRMDSTSVRHPLAADGESNYRYASGDTLTVTLPEGQTVRLVELRIQPRRRDTDLISGSFWLDSETHAVVQAHFTMARPYESARDPDRRGGLAGFLVPDVTAELNYFSVQYAFWDQEWWLPRLVAARGTIAVAGGRFPLTYERTYGEYEVWATPADVLATLDTLRTPGARPCRPAGRFTVNVNRPGAGAALPGDSAAAAAGADGLPASAPSPAAPAADTAAPGRRTTYERQGDTTFVRVQDEDCDRVYVVAPEPGANLLASPYLPRRIYGRTEGLIRQDDLRAVQDRMGGPPSIPWYFQRPSFDLGLTAPGLVRYNRVEGLSVGARVLVPFGPTRNDLTVRFGLGDRTLGGELGAGHELGGWALRAAGYRRLDTMDGTMPAFGLPATLGALLLGRDEHDYFRATGVEVTGETARTRGARTTWRLFAERHAAVERETNASLRRALGGGHEFRLNPTADAASQLGASVHVSTQLLGANPAGVRLGLQAGALAETGDFRFVRPDGTLQLGFPMGPLIGALEGAAGTSFGDLSVQRAWRLGGAGTLRGYQPGSAVGTAFWRGRAEVGTRLPAARLTAFSDFGWAGDRAAFTMSGPLWSAGAGVSFLDGLIRLDLARPVRDGGGWRAHFTFGGML